MCGRYLIVSALDGELMRPVNRFFCLGGEVIEWGHTFVLATCYWLGLASSGLLSNIIAEDARNPPEADPRLSRVAMAMIFPSTSISGLPAANESAGMSVSTKLPCVSFSPSEIPVMMPWATRVEVCPAIATTAVPSPAPFDESVTGIQF